MSSAIAGMFAKSGTNYLKKMAQNRARKLANNAQRRAKNYARNQLMAASVAAQNRAKSVITQHLGNTPGARALTARVNSGTRQIHNAAIARVNASPHFRLTF
jgi:hypothetical protein